MIIGNYDNSTDYQNSVIRNLKTKSFLGLINVFGTKNATGECAGFQIAMPGHTNTDVQERTPSISYSSPGQQFQCEQINIDSFIKYEKLDAIAGKYTDFDFKERLDRHLDTQTYLALLMVGFNGEKRGDLSDPSTHKKAQDVKKGWLQKIRENGAGQIIGSPSVGKDQQYKTLKSLVKAGLAKIEEPIRTRGNLVALVGQNLMDGFSVKPEYRTMLAGVDVYKVPHFPENSILITSLNNLSLMVHIGTVRRTLKDKPSLNRIENYFSMNVDFIIEDYKAVALIENIQMSDE